jgi:hypothetical protein
MFSVNGGFQGKAGQCTACRHGSVFIGREAKKTAVLRAPPVRHIMHYEFGVSSPQQ